MQNRLRNYCFYSKLIYYNHQQQIWRHLRLR